MSPRRRLEVLAAFLLSGAADEQTFNMGSWPTCAIGEGAMRIPSLEGEGLALVESSSYDEGMLPQYVAPRSHRVYQGYEAVQRFFGLNSARAGQIFGPRRRTPQEVGREITSLLRKT